jgi:hypothetical protein
MGKDKGAPEGPESDEPRAPDTAASRESRSDRLRRRRRDSRRRWLMGVATTVLAGVLVWAITTIGLPSMVHAAGRWFSSSRPEGARSPGAGKSSVPSTPGSGGGGAPAGHGHTPICSLQMVSEDPLDSWEVHAWTFPTGFMASAKQIAQINEADNNAELINRYLYDYGGYAPFTYTQLILHNNCSKSIIIKDIQVSKICQPTLDGTIFAGQPELSEPSSVNEGTYTGSNLDPTQIGFDLDSPDPEAMLASGWNVRQWTQEYASSSLATIPGDRDYAFDIRAIALHTACSFRIQVTYLYDDKSHTETISDDGQPFRVSALLPGTLKPQKAGNHPYAGYDTLYVGWHASLWPDGTWVRENPKTWQ